MLCMRRPTHAEHLPQVEESHGRLFPGRCRNCIWVGKRIAWTRAPIGSRLQGTSSDETSVMGDDKKKKIQKGKTPEHTAREQGVPSSANKSTDFGAGVKEKVLHIPITVPQTEGQSEPGISRRATDHETPQVQGQHAAVRTERAMGNDPPIADCDCHE